MIGIAPALAAAKAAAGTENNPLILWDDLFAGAVATTDVGTEQADGTAANAATGATYDYWSALEDAGSVAWAVDIGGAVSIDCVGLAAHNIGTLGGTVVIQHSSDGVAWSNTDALALSPADDAAILVCFTLTAARYWRVLVTGLTGGDLVSVGVIMGGMVTTMPRRIYQGYAPPLTPTRVSVTPNISQGGHLLGVSVERRGSSATAAFANLPDTFLRGSEWLGFQARANDGNGFFWAWRPTKYGDVFFAWAVAPIMPTNAGPKALMSVEIAMGFYDG